MKQPKGRDDVVFASPAEELAFWQRLKGEERVAAVADLTLASLGLEEMPRMKRVSRLVRRRVRK